MNARRGKTQFADQFTTGPLDGFTILFGLGLARAGPGLIRARFFGGLGL